MNYAQASGTYTATFDFATDTTYNTVTGTASTGNTVVQLYLPNISVTLTAGELNTATLGSPITFIATVQGATNGPSIFKRSLVTDTTGTGTWQITNGVSCDNTTVPAD